jgi:PKD repeat protein
VQSPSHTYSTVGNYTVNLTVIGPEGSDSEVKTGYINVSNPVTTKTVAAFSASPTSGAHPLNVTFTDKSTGYPESWYWEFGDSITSTEQTYHTYSTAGKYTVNLTEKNLAGNSTKSMSGDIKVS